MRRVFREGQLLVYGLMKFTIITVCYNSSAFLWDAIVSVKNQTYQNIEYIIVDGGSTDGTIDIIRESEHLFGGRLSWISEKDKGLYDAMNKGIQRATGDIIGLINSDDLFCDNQAIEKVVNIFTREPNLDSVYADLYYVSQKDTDKIIRRWESGTRKPFKRGWHPAHPTLYIKREIYQKYGLFNLDFRLAADFEIMLRFFDKFQISTYYLRDPLVKMRLGGTTNKSLKNVYLQNIECIKAFAINHLKVSPFLYPFLRIAPKLSQFKIW